MCPVAPMTTTRLMSAILFYVIGESRHRCTGGGARATRGRRLRSAAAARWSARRERRPDRGALDVAVFQRAQTGNVVSGQRCKTAPRQVSPAEVTHQDVGAASMAPLKEPRHPSGQLALVKCV